MSSVATTSSSGIAGGAAVGSDQQQQQSETDQSGPGQRVRTRGQGARFMPRRVQSNEDLPWLIKSTGSEKEQGKERE